MTFNLRRSRARTGVVAMRQDLLIFFFEFYPFFSPTSWYPMFSSYHLDTILSHRYNSRTGSGATKVESHASSDTQPNQSRTAS